MKISREMATRMMVESKIGSRRILWNSSHFKDHMEYFFSGISVTTPYDYPSIFRGRSRTENIRVFL